MRKKSTVAVWIILCVSAAGWGYAGLQLLKGSEAEQAALREWDRRHPVFQDAFLAGAPPDGQGNPLSQSGVLETAAAPASSSSAAETRQMKAVLGVLHFPKTDKRVPFFAGIGADILKKGAGLDPHGVLPGEPGNTVISGHRDTVFRVLNQTEPGDEIQVETGTGMYTYTVETVEIVRETAAYSFPEEDFPVLRLITCYPFYYAGPAPERFIATARLSQEKN